MQTLIVATSNPGKLKEIQAYLTEKDCQLQLKPSDLEIEETGTTFADNACLKASQVALALNQWAIADDSGLRVAALGGAPGLYSARYGSSDQARIERVLRELGENGDRRAEFVCAVAIARPDGTIAAQAEGICDGEILYTQQGQGGFGYDPIFFVPDLNKSFAEMSPEQKHEVSHRGKAFAHLLSQWPEK